MGNSENAIETLDLVKIFGKWFYEIIEEEKHTIKVCNLDCAACASELEEELEKIDGVKANVSFVNQKVNFSIHFVFIMLCWYES